MLVVQMPSEPSVTRFYVAVQAAMGAPLRAVVTSCTTCSPAPANAAANSST